MSAISRASKASISATPAVYGGDTTVTFYPGRYMGKELAVQITCSQAGVAVGDHYLIVMGPLSWPSHGGGGAECEVIGIHYGNNPTPAASGSFPLGAR